MKAAVEQVFDGSLTQVAIGGAYDASKINRGKHTGQFNLGAGLVDRFVGPAAVGVANFGESPQAIPSPFIHVVKITDDLFWIFGADAASPAVTRRVQLWTFVPSTNTYTFAGFIVLTFPTTGNVTARGLRAILENYTVGTVGVSGTAVTGSGTSWATGLSVGSRIGFGSTDPMQITTWYQVSAIGSDTSITLTGSAGTIAAGSPYVIQDLMIVHANSNGTNGGLFVAKGLRYEDFAPTGNTIPAATTIDKIKAVYWLKDAGTITNTTIGGCALGDRDSWTQQYVYASDGAGTVLKLFRYNIRAPLTSLGAGAFVLTGTDIVVTGNQSVTGNITLVNNGRVATLNHGPGSGVPSLYLLTSTRVVRVPLSAIVASSTTFVADSMSEVPPGGGNTNLSVSTLTTMDVAGSIDKLVITSVADRGTIYITDYYTGGQQIDRRAGCLASQLPSALRDTDSPIFVHSLGGQTPFVWVEDGWLFHLYAQSSTTNLNALSAYPLAADADFQADVNNRVICPKITLGATPAKLYRALVNAAENIGGYLMGVAPDMFRLQVRTSGIDDNSGTWTDVAPNGDLSGLGTPSAIQFAFQFRTAGVIMLPARVLSLALIYETDDALPSQYRWNFADSDQANGTFGFTQAALFGAAPGLHTINIYRADTNALVLTQASSGTTNGNFQYWNGTAWVNGLGSDVVGTRRRFVPTGSLPSGVDLYATVTVA
ncbi:MAG: hypothetical protein ING02_14600 [Roseomonas sp.]|nr:hypothetical protein [Roseomonas sp.]